MVDVWNSDEELEAVDAMTVEQIRAHVTQPNRCWSDTYCDCVQQRAAERMLEHYDALAAEVAALKAQLAYAASTGDECAIEVESLRSRLAEADALLRDIAEMRVTAIPSMFMDESMAAAARAHLSRKADSAPTVHQENKS